MKPLQVYLPETFIKHLKQKALNDGCSVSDLVRDALGADNDVLLTNKIVVPKVIKEPIKANIPRQLPSEDPLVVNMTMDRPQIKIAGAVGKVTKVEVDKETNAVKAGEYIMESKSPEPFKFPPSAASGVIKTSEDAKKATESPTFISKSYSARKPGSKERHVEL